MIVGLRMLKTRPRLVPGHNMTRPMRCARLITPLYMPMQYIHQQSSQGSETQSDAGSETKEHRKPKDTLDMVTNVITPAGVEEKQKELSAPDPCFDVVRRGRLPAIIYRNGVVTLC